MADLYDRATVLVGFVLLNTMFALGLIQATARYVDLPFSVYWSGEVTRHFLSVMTIIAIPYLFKNDSDISFLPVLERIVTRMDVLMIFRNVFLLGFTVVLGYSSWLVYNISYQVTLPTLRWVKIRWAYAIFGAIAVLLFIFIIIDTRTRIREADITFDISWRDSDV